MSIVFHPVPHGVTWSHYRVVQASPDGFDAETVYKMQLLSSPIRQSSGVTSLAHPAVLVSLLSLRSWVVRGRKTHTLLLHERAHYIIATLIGRELERAARAMTASDGASLQKALENLVKEKASRATDVGDAYDDDSRHGTDAVQQQAWMARVHSWEMNGNTVDWP